MAKPGMGRSASVPGILSMGTGSIRGNNAKKTTLAYQLDGAVDLSSGPAPPESAVNFASKLQTPSWRTQTSDGAQLQSMEDPSTAPKNMRWPRVAPAWLKHDKHVLRFYAHFQESVSERNDENARYRHCQIMLYMEDGTISITENKVENSGLPQGAFLKRHRVPRNDGMGFIGPADFTVGTELKIYGRQFRITGVDRFTRWFFEENGVDLGPDEEAPTNLWETSYKTSKLFEKGECPTRRNVTDAKKLNQYVTGNPPVAAHMAQFLKGDRKVLRFKAFWDDKTLYGARIYFTIHFYLADNSVEINEQHCRNSGRDKYPVFYKRGPLLKENHATVYPGMLIPDPLKYLPEDFIVGQSINVYRRVVQIYDVDDFTRKFYKEHMDIDQRESVLDVSDPPLTHAKLAPPPHLPPGTEEDSLINCVMVQPKPPKQDLVRLMTLTGVVLRFECKMVDCQPEDTVRRLVVGFFPANDSVACWELAQRNSGFMAGKFREKHRAKNPDTGVYFKLDDFAVGKTIVIACQRLLMIRADEATLTYMERRPDEVAVADPMACARRIAPTLELAELQDENGVDPDRLKELAYNYGVDLIDHEIITLLRAFGVNVPESAPMISGPAVCQALGIRDMNMP